MPISGQSTLSSARTRAPKRISFLFYASLAFGIALFSTFFVWPVLVFAFTAGVDIAHNQGEQVLSHIRSDFTSSSILRSVIFASAATSLQATLALYVARLTFRPGAGNSVVQDTLVLLPITIAGVGTAMMWRTILSHDGALNSLLGLFSDYQFPWLSTDPLVSVSASYRGALSSGMLSSILIDTWLWFPILTGLFIITFRYLSGDQYEAAILDGASLGIIFWRIYLPRAAPALATMALFRFLDGLRSFDLQLALFGRTTALETVAGRIYSYVFYARDENSAITLSLIAFLGCFPLAVVFLCIVSRGLRDAFHVN